MIMHTFLVVSESRKDVYLLCVCVGGGGGGGAITKSKGNSLCLFICTHAVSVPLCIVHEKLDLPGTPQSIH